MRGGIALPGAMPDVRPEVIPRWAAEAAEFARLGTVGRIAFPGVMDSPQR